MGLIFLAVEAQRDFSFADVQLLQRYFRQPVRQVRIEQQYVERCYGINTQHGLDNRKQRRSRPSLRPVGFGIQGREWMLAIALVAAEAFRQATEIEQSG